MVKDKVTREDLQNFAVGEQKVFTLPTFEKAKSATVQAYQAKNYRVTYGGKFKAIIADPIDGSLQRRVTITRIA